MGSWPERRPRLVAGVEVVGDKYTMSTETDGSLDNWHDLLSLIFQTLEYQATNPRDGICAILGFGAFPIIKSGLRNLCRTDVPKHRQPKH